MYLKTQNPKNFSIYHATPVEISDIIQNHNSNKSIGAKSLSIKVLKSIKGVILVSLCEIIHKSFASDILPDILKY